MNRRDLLRIGVSSAALPMAGIAQHAHVAALAPVSAVSGADWKPQVFDDHQNATVEALADLIIPATDTPGAKAALVNRYLDLLLSDGPAEPVASFLEGLGWLDGYAIRKYSHAFVGCSPDQQAAILTALDTNGEPGLDSGSRFFQEAKSWISQIYYRTEIGMNELNKGGRVPAKLPECEHPAHA